LTKPLIRLRLKLMKRSRSQLAGLLVALGLCAAALTIARSREVDARGALETAKARQAMALAESRRLEGLATAAEQKRKHLTSLLSKTGSIGSNSTQAKKNTANLPSIGERLRKEPAIQLAYIAAQRARAAMQYGALFRQLNLSGAQMEKFEDLLAHRAEGWMDLQAAFSSQGIALTDPVVGQSWKELNDQFQSAELALLGPAAYAQAFDYNRSAAARDMVDNYAGGAVVVVGEPFTPQQGEQLVSIIANASESYRNGGEFDSQNIDWATVEANARPILTPGQFQLISNMEPPLPAGARFQTQLYRTVSAAQQQDAAAPTEASLPSDPNG
jgi:hypothetical protein